MQRKSKTQEELVAERGAEAGRLCALLRRGTSEPIQTNSDFYLFGPDNSIEENKREDFLMKMKLDGPLAIRISHIGDGTYNYVAIAKSNSRIVFSAKGDDWICQHNPSRNPDTAAVCVKTPNFGGYEVRIIPYINKFKR